MELDLKKTEEEKLRSDRFEREIFKKQEIQRKLNEEIEKSKSSKLEDKNNIETIDTELNEATLISDTKSNVTNEIDNTEHESTESCRILNEELTTNITKPTEHEDDVKIAKDCGVSEVKLEENIPINTDIEIKEVKEIKLKEDNELSTVDNVSNSRDDIDVDDAFNKCKIPNESEIELVVKEVINNDKGTLVKDKIVHDYLDNKKESILNERDELCFEPEEKNNKKYEENTSFEWKEEVSVNESKNNVLPSDNVGHVHDKDSILEIDTDKYEHTIENEEMVHDLMTEDDRFSSTEYSENCFENFNMNNNSSKIDMKNLKNIVYNLKREPRKENSLEAQKYEMSKNKCYLKWRKDHQELR